MLRSAQRAINNYRGNAVMSTLTFELSCELVRLRSPEPVSNVLHPEVMGWPPVFPLSLRGFPIPQGISNCHSMYLYLPGTN